MSAKINDFENYLDGVNENFLDTKNVSNCETKLKLKFEALKKKILDTNKPDLVIDLINLYYDTRAQQYNEGRKSVLTENTKNE